MTSVFGYCKADPNIPIDELDYGYIEKCKDINKLQKILEILRSGEEGKYPALEQFTEKQLAKKKPDSPLLEKCTQEKLTRDMPKDDIRKAVDDLKNLSSCQPVSPENEQADGSLPPIRSSKTTEDIKEIMQEEVPNISNHVKKSVCPKGPEYWEKISKQVDEDKDGDFGNVCEEKSSTSNIKSKGSKPAHELLTHQKVNLDKLNSDPNVAAQNEKNKGNEAFRSGDYKEALVYYSRSLDILPTAASYNNRAITLIKIENFREALDDCEKVISLEPNNIKAYMRRGIANQSLGFPDEAYADFTKVVELEPSNKRGKELLEKVTKELEKKNLSPKKKGTRMKIEEINTNSETSGMHDKNNEDNESSNTVDTKPKDHIIVINESKSTECVSDDIQETNAENNYSEKDNEMRHCMESHVNNTENNETCSFANESTENNENNENEKCINPLDDNIISNNKTDLNTCNFNEQLGTVSEEKGGEVNIQAVLELPVNVIEMKDNGNILYKTGQYDKACEMYTSCIDILSENKSGYKEALVTLLSNRSSCLMKMGNSKQSISDCDQSISLLPTSKVYMKRACAYESMEKYINAYVDYQNVLKLDPSSVNSLHALSRLGNVLRSQYGDSWRETLHKTDTLSLYNMIPGSVNNINMSEENIPSGENKITKNIHDTNADKKLSVQKDNQLNDHSQTVPCTDYLSKCETGQKDLCHDDRKEPITEEVQKEDDNATIDNNTKPGLGDSKISNEKLAKERRVLDFFEMKEKGNTCVQQEKYEDAVKYYTKCVELLPKEIPSYTNRALCYLKLKQPANAIQDCSQALKLQPSCVKALFRRAQARRTTKEFKEALADLSKVLKIEPNNNAIKKELELCKAEFHAELRNIQAQNEAAKKKDSLGKGKKVPIEEVFSDSAEFSIKGKMSTKVGKCPLAKGNTQRSNPLKKMTGFEFLHAWNNVKSEKTTEYADLLMQIDPSKLPELLSNKLDGEILKNLIRTVNEHFTNKETYKQGIQLLKSLCKVSRFVTMLMFLNTTEKTLLRCTIDQLENRVKQSSDKSLLSDVSSLRTSYRCP